MREAEILKAVYTAWAAVANSATLLPGGLHEYAAENDNVPNASEKYATMRCVESAPARETNGGPIRKHMLTITLHANDGIAANASLMDSIASIRTTISKSLDNGGTLIDMWTASSGESGGTDDSRQGKPLVKQSVAWDIQSRWPY